MLAFSSCLQPCENSVPEPTEESLVLKSLRRVTGSCGGCRPRIKDQWGGGALAAIFTEWAPVSSARSRIGLGVRSSIWKRLQDRVFRSIVQLVLLDHSSFFPPLDMLVFRNLVLIVQEMWLFLGVGHCLEFWTESQWSHPTWGCSCQLWKL